MLKVASVTIANGGDNIGIYVPLFIGMGITAMLLTVLIFGLLTALWCLISLKLATHPVIRKSMEAYQHILVPVVFIGLGIFILLKNGTLVLIGRIFKKTQQRSNCGTMPWCR
ncbi:cadmium resistance transporter [Acetobacterium wieringae]|uniref:cadmium resistance transporter n=1 Tax=Acetobacterium wieringae TaxID=52694 RepID=UPI0031591C22